MLHIRLELQCTEILMNEQLQCCERDKKSIFEMGHIIKSSSEISFLVIQNNKKKY